jgi:hypothetical protein
MALGSGHIINTDYAEFIPEMWSDEVIGAYKQNLVVGNHVTKINHRGKKGDTIHIPQPSRGAANAKAAEAQVTLNNPANTEVTVSIDKHYEYSYLIEDITSVQALDSLRRFYTDDAGYALAKQVDQDLMILGALAQGSTQYSTAVIGSDGSTTWDPTANTNTGNAAALTDNGIRQMIQTLDDADVPMMGRVMILPPVEKNNLLGISRFTEQAFTGEAAGGNTIRTGYIANVYGVPVYVTTHCVWGHVDGADGEDYYSFASTTPADATITDATGTSVTWSGTANGDTKVRVGLMMHKDAFAFAEQMSVRSQTQYKQEYLADLFTADTIYGTSELRDNAAVTFVVPS